MPSWLRSNSTWRMVCFVLLPDQRHDSIGVLPLIEGVVFGALPDDKAFDVDWIRVKLDDHGSAAVTSPKANHKAAINFEGEMYRWRHFIENTFAKLKRVQGPSPPGTTKPTPATPQPSISQLRSSPHAERQQTLVV
jgi:hypothetical protein